MIAEATEVANEAADFAKLSDEVALQRATAASKQPETVMIKTEIAVREEWPVAKPAATPTPHLDDYCREK